MENNLESKSKFFAQYWGQEVFEWKYPENSTKPGVIVKHPDLLNYTGCFFLNLKSLSDIKDGDAKWLCNHFGWSWCEDYPNDDGECSLDKGGVSDLAMVELMEFECCHSGIKMIHATDYLRSKGYALPFNGLSVEDQIKYGWIKIKSDE